MSPFTAVALVRAPSDAGRSPETVPVDPITETPWNGWQVDAILFRDTDGSGNLSPIVIAEYMTGIGPTGAQPFVQIAVYTWNGKKFAHAARIEKALDGAKDAGEVDRRLAALKKRE